MSDSTVLPNKVFYCVMWFYMNQLLYELYFQEKFKSIEIILTLSFIISDRKKKSLHYIKQFLLLSHVSSDTNYGNCIDFELKHSYALQIPQNPRVFCKPFLLCTQAVNGILFFYYQQCDQERDNGAFRSRNIYMVSCNIYPRYEVHTYVINFIAIFFTINTTYIIQL